MCGISGVVSLKGNRIERAKDYVSVMSNILEHRGPDGSGLWENSDKTVGLGHRRLAVIDLNKNAGQPMESAGGTVVTFNGEIYNYLEIQDELKAKWQFRTNSDTEAILAAYERYGFDCLSKFRGMFAFYLG